jgi:hypothetical protein
MRHLAEESVADSGSIAFWTLHGLHIALVAGGAVAVLLLLAPGRFGRFRAGRLRRLGSADAIVAAAEQRARAELSGARPRRAHPALLSLVATNLLAAAIHGAVCPEHFEEGLRFGVFFLVLTVAQVFLAVAAARNPSPRIVTLGLVVNLEVIALWVLTRTVGLPYRLAEVEAVGLWDTVATLAEIGALAASVVLLGATARRRAAAAPARALAR